MKLMTKAIIDRLPKLGETEQIPLEKKTFIFKFFCPWNQWTWYVVEGELQGGARYCRKGGKEGVHLGETYVFFGYVVGHEREWGYFTLEELEEAKGPGGLKIERDRSFNDVPAIDIIGPDRMETVSIPGHS